MFKVFEMKFSYFIIITIFIYTNCLCQQTFKINENNIQSKPAGIKYNFRTYDLEKGLDNSYILALAEDKFGNIWLGSNGSGVCKFDGNDFKWFSNFNGASNIVVQSIFKDSKGNLWIGTFGNGISKFDGYNFITFNTDNGLASNKIWSINEDNQGNIWVGTHDNGVSKFDGKNFINYNINNGLISNLARTIFKDNIGNIWIGSSKGITVFDGKSFTKYDSTNGLPDENIIAITQNKNNKIIIGSYGDGIYEFKDGLFNEFKYNEQLTSKFICALLTDKQGNIWIAESRGGIDKFDGNKITHFTVKEGLNNNEVIALIEDKASNIWIGTYGSGLCKFSGEKFSYFSSDEGLSSNVIRAIVEDSIHNLWISTSGGMINKFDSQNFYFYNENTGINNRFILSSVIDKNGNLWFGTSGNGAILKTGNNLTYYTENEGLSSNYILNIFCDSKNRIWFGTYGGYACYYNNGTFTKIDKKNGLTSNFINIITEDSQGNIWFGSENDGVFVYDGRIVKKAFLNEIGNKSIKSLLFDKSGCLWIGTYGNGVYKTDKSEVKCFNDSNGLINNFAQSLLQDNNGNIWIGTNKGIVKLIDNKENKSKNINLPVFENYYIKSFGFKEGFIGNNCSANAIFSDNNGKIWIGTGKNLTKYNPDFDNINEIKPAVYLKEIRLFFESIDWKNNTKYPNLKRDSLSENYNVPYSLIAPYNYNHFTFIFSAVNMSFPEKTKYKFKLEGLDRDWSPSTNKNEITYSGLKPGKYTFYIVAINEDGVSSEKPYEFYLEIVPPWWETNLFRICAIIFIIVSIILIIKFREQKLQKAKEKLEQIVKERTAEVVKQKDEIANKNEELSQQNEEITAQRDEIEAQRDIVVSQKNHIELINTEITDSIKYAKRIQEAMLPDFASTRGLIPLLTPNDMESTRELIPLLTPSDMESTRVLIPLLTLETFILFKPKDVVSGDFYWATQISTMGHDPLLIVAVADCTGHGVPGAFMSMLGISFLNDIVIKQKITTPSIILDELRIAIIVALKQTGETGTQNISSSLNVKDGMDMSLIVINLQASTSRTSVSEQSDLETLKESSVEALPQSNISVQAEPVKIKPTEALPQSNRGSYNAQWAGANNPLWLVRSSKEMPPFQKVASLENTVTQSSELSSNEPEVRDTELTNQKFVLQEVKPDKQPVAIYENMKPFTNHEIQLYKGDIIYLMSDGYEDQFGGPKGKKFLSKNLKQLLVDNSQLTMKEQKEKLEKTLFNWIGDGEQIDDITILGLSI